MTATLWGLYAGYLLWLLAGCVDFHCHRRTDLPHTSGVAESTTHLLELALLGAAVVAWLVFDITASTVMLMFALYAASIMPARGMWVQRLLMWAQVLAVGIQAVSPWVGRLPNPTWPGVAAMASMAIAMIVMRRQIIAFLRYKWSDDVSEADRAIHMRRCSLKDASCKN